MPETARKKQAQHRPAPPRRDFLALLFLDDTVKVVAVGTQGTQQSLYPWKGGGALKTLDLTKKRITLEKLLELATAGSIRILTADGRTFVLEEDDFEKEVELLGKSRKLRRFLSERSKEPATTSLEDDRRSLD
jgi:hypothetical protein